jgi:hypothetical protein
MIIIKFITFNSLHFALCINYIEHYIEEAVTTKFLRLQTDNHLSWKNHIEQIIPKLNEACYMVRSTVPLSLSHQCISHTVITL